MRVVKIAASFSVKKRCRSACGFGINRHGSARRKPVWKDFIRSVNIAAVINSAARLARVCQSFTASPSIPCASIMRLSVLLHGGSYCPERLHPRWPGVHKNNLSSSSSGGLRVLPAWNMHDYLRKPPFSLSLSLSGSLLEPHNGTDYVYMKRYLFCLDTTSERSLIARCCPAQLAEVSILRNFYFYFYYLDQKCQTVLLRELSNHHNRARQSHKYPSSKIKDHCVVLEHRVLKFVS